MGDSNNLADLFGSGEAQPQSSDQASVIVIDDNSDVIDALTSLLEQDFDLISCLSFDAAERRVHEKIQLGRLPVIVLDIKMAGKDGLEVFGLLKEIHPDLKIIFHSAYPGSDVHARMVAGLPHAGYLTKGEYTLTELIQTIRTAMR